MQELHPSSTDQVATPSLVGACGHQLMLIAPDVAVLVYLCEGWHSIAVSCVMNAASSAHCPLLPTYVAGGYDDSAVAEQVLLAVQVSGAFGGGA